MASVRDFIINASGNFYMSPNLHIDEKSEDILSDFIHNSPTILQTNVDSNNQLHFYTQIQCNLQKSLVFYKTIPQDLTAEDALNHLNIISLSNNAAESLYQIHKQVYSPLLAAGDSLYSNKLQKNLSDLESNLRALTHGKGGENINVILTIEDEVDYWKRASQKKDASKKEREAASAYCVLFEDVSGEIRIMQSSPMVEVRDSAENIGGILDDIWQCTTILYEEGRMIHIFDVVGHIICSTIQKAITGNQLWKIYNNSKDNDILTLVTESLNVIQTWLSACKSLTETYWPNYALHTWNGKPYIPSFCLNFKNRIQEIYDIRSTYNQLSKLLTKSEKEELRTDNLFEAFESINIWIYNGPNHSWESAVSIFSAKLRPIEIKIAEKLKPRMRNTSIKQTLYEFMRYKTLINRHHVKQALFEELEVFVSSLLALLKSIQGQLNADDGDVRMYQPPEMSPIIQQVQWAKQTEARVKDIQACTESYLSEFDGSLEVLKLSSQLLKDLKSMYTQLHEEWSRDLQAQVKDGSLALSGDKPVVEFSGSSRLMVVTFNPRLVRAEREARALAAAGLPPPPAALALRALTAVLGQARALHQVASFHNTLGERMIPSTRPMMLAGALELAALVRDQKPVYWTDSAQLAAYTDTLKNMLLKLETQNNYLTSQHIAIRSIVEKLLNTELLAKQAEWKKKIKDIRDIIEKTEANGYKSTEMWRAHWDQQLYKALECQYIRALLSLHSHFPHVKVDLILRGHCVRVQPAMEEVRAQHYAALRRLVALPAQFAGLGAAPADTRSVFAPIVDKHSWLGNKAVRQLEGVLASLERACDEWTRRAALACVRDLDALCAEHLRDPHDWELNFKACKAYGQAVAKMAFEDEKIEWITVGTAGLRRELEAAARLLWGALAGGLRGSCARDAAAVRAFAAAARLVLAAAAAPRNARELAELSAKQRAVHDQTDEMEQIVENLKKKGHMLRTWGGDPFVDDTIKEWQKIREQMASHKQMFEHQAELVKSSLSGEWENLCSAVEAWASRWGRARARLANVHDAARADMLARARDVFDAIASLDKCFADRDYLLKECEKFNMKCEISEIWTEAEKLKKEYEILWSPLKEYNEDYEALGEQEWMLFQKKLHLLDEFVLKWSAKLEPYTVVTLFIKQELDKYSDLTTALKYLRGSDFTEIHWREVYSLVNMEYKKPDTLQLKDFLGVAANVKKQLKELQKIYSTASNEATIRSALNELELWYAGARLSVVQHGDKAKRLTPIVKDFKEILNKIEEQQWVVSSLGGANDACAAWDARLRAARALVRSTHHAQRRWLYLEPILCDDDGELGAKFRKVDQGFRQAARALAADPRLSALVQSPRLQPMLDAISDQLNSCQAALNLYIDEKRSVFPRLYFLSDDDLLELLGQARAGAEGRESVMQSHLKKLFPGITGVRLGPGELSITALCSDYGEIFQMEHPVDIDCPVEIWLKKLETEIRSSLQNMTLKCIVSNSLQQQDPFSLPTQILCLAQNIRFTDQAEKAITSKELHKLKTSVERENINYATAEVDEESEKRKRQALILQCSYYLSVVQILIDNNVDTVGDWYWQKQLRFYLKNSKDIVAKMGLAEISYSYEYLGVNTGQFVRTEVADECFLILTQALHLGLVGNPFGPAGTGKTESVKALGALVGRLVLIFNCDEAMDGECMGRLLSGLALSGAWGCFDEFNRLGGGTLAAVAHQLCALLDATRARAHGAEATALLNGKQVRVSEWCGVAATMNPAGRGYGGRRALPGAVARALRPVALQPPPARPLARQLFAAQGVACADALAADIQAVFEFASTLLSDQRHYDWGLRALKAAVGSCGVALATAGEKVASEQRAALRRVLRLNNLSKLTRYDAESFENILLMVFADVPEEEPNSNPIYAGLEVTVANLGLVRNNHQIQKCVELYEQLQQRMGVVIVGPPGSGKSTIRRLLKTTLQQQQNKSIVEYVIYPKAMSRNDLLGYIDPDTRQWTDGVMSTVALEVSNQPSDVWSWVVCDGDVDPEWVEALNSVLDDNRLLTLPSGGRVRFAHNVNFLFETHSLHHASPATISRLGIILLSEESNCSSEIAENWLAKAEFENETAKLSLPLLNQAIKKCMQWFNSHRSDVAIKFYDISMVKQIITQFEYIAQESTNMKYTTPEELVFRAIQRSTNDILKESAVDSFYDELRVICGAVGTVGGPESPVGGERAGEWASEELYVSERVAARLPALRALLADPGAHVLVIGPDACAKSTIADYILKENNATVITIDCTPILEPTDIIEELKRHNVIGSDGRASGGGRVTLFVRGLDRARVDAWGSSAVHSFLLQVVREGGAWSRAEGEAGPQWRRAARLRLLLTARRAAATPRLAAALALFSMPEPDDDELLELSRSYLKENITRSISDIDTTTLARSVLSMFKEVIETFSSIFHCKWNPSHLKKWCENIKWYNVTSAADVMTSIKAEADCIFKDSLITDEEKTEFDEIAKRFLRNYNSEVFYKAQPRSDGIYLEAVDYSEWCLTTQKLINQCLSENENMFGETGVEVCPELAVLYKAACRAASSGVVVMVGGAGCGRRAAAQLAGAALPAAVFVAESKDHVHSQFRAALSSASEGRTLLVLGESSATEQTLACVEAWRAARGPHALPAALRPHARQADGSRHAMLDIKQNLGIIICLDKDQDNLGELMEKYPFIYTESHLVWQERWSEATLRRLPALIIQRLKKENISENSESQCDEVPVEEFVKVYNSLETDSQRAPCRYVCFVKSYYHVVTRKRETLLNRRNMLSAGVEALRRARTEVATLQGDAAQQEAELSEKRAAGARALDQIGATVRATTDRQDEMHALKVAIEQENDALQTRKKEIEAELASVEPVIAAARAAVGDIRPESLSEVRSLRAPPDVVRDILEGVLRLMGIADTSWHSMKNFLSKRGVKEDIRNLDVSQVSEEAVSAVERLVARRGASFEPAAARRASAACAPLAAWVRAHLAHAAAERRVRPLRDQQNKLQKNLKEAEDQLAALSSGLATVDERVGALKEQLGRHSREAAALELRLAAAAGTIRAARRLLDQLASEYDAWEIDLQNISKEIIELSQRSLLAAAYIVYLPDLTEPQARLYITKWSSLIGFDDPSISIINYICSAEKQLKWEGEGLSSDESAVKNAVWLDQALQIPKCDLTALIIDPDGEAIEWLKRTMSDTPCQFIPQDSDKLQTTLQYANRLNRVVVVTDVESLASAWWGGVRVVLATRRAVPAGAHAPPHVVAKLAPLHFAARPHALADQLVNYAIQKRNPEVNEKSKEIKQTRATLQRRRLELQENLLSELSMNGDILNDANLLASLNKMRETSATISEALASAQAVEVEGRSARDAYSSSGERAAALALALRRLAARRPLLALPADTALDAFVDALATQDPKNIDSDRVTKYFTKRIIERVLLSLHKKDKYAVVLYLLKYTYAEIITNELWQLFLGTCNIIEDQESINHISSTYRWIDAQSVKKVAQLKMKNEDLFNRLCLDKVEMWKEFVHTGELHVISKLGLSAFETVAVAAVMRPGSVYRAVVAFVDYILGSGVMSGGGEVARALRWSRATRPVLLLAAHAADVLGAHASALSLSLVQVGIEEGRSAWEAGLEGTRGGGWLMLAVGASPFPRELRDFLASLATRPAEYFSEVFRLWVACEDREVPLMISNLCVSVVIEAPSGVKHNAAGSLGAWRGARADARLQRHLACLALFHALAQERRAYIPLGWSAFYEWGWSEVFASGEAARAAGAGRAARELCGALYAARVPGAADRRVLAALLRATLADAAFAHAWRPPGFPAPLPYATDMQAYMTAFEALPEIDSPQLLCLPANCRVAWETNAADGIISGLRDLDTAASSKKSDNLAPLKSDSLAPLKSLLALWKKLMSGSPLIKGDYQVDNRSAGWWGAVCGAEALDAARAARRLHAALSALAARARRPDADITLDDTPEEWQVWWAGPARAEAYVREFCHRARAAHARLQPPAHADADYMPSEVDLREWLSPQRVVCALRARTASRLARAPHALRVALDWDAAPDAKSDGQGMVTLHGLRLSGCSWAAGGLRASAALAPPHTPAPPLRLRCVPVSESEVDDSFSLPLYSSEAREALVLAARAPLAPGFARDTAILHAAALFVAPLD